MSRVEVLELLKVPGIDVNAKAKNKEERIPLVCAVENAVI